MASTDQYLVPWILFVPLLALAATILGLPIPVVGIAIWAAMCALTVASWRLAWRLADFPQSGRLVRDGVLLLAASAAPVASLVVFPSPPPPDVRNSQAFFMLAMANGWAMLGATWLLVRGYGGATLLAYPLSLQAHLGPGRLACRSSRPAGRPS